MGNIRSLDIGVDDLWLMPGGYEELFCTYITLLKPGSASLAQLAQDIGLSSDDASPLFAITLAGWERAPHIHTVECFSLEVIARVPINPNDLPIATDPRILIEIILLMLANEAHEVCRQRVFRHEERASKDNMVRISALHPGVSFIEKCGENGGVDIRLLPDCSLYQRIRDNEILTLGMMLIGDGKRPFESLIEKPRKPPSGSYDFTHLLEFYELGYKLFEKAKRTLKTIEHLPIEKQREAIRAAYEEMDACLVDRMLSRDGYVATPSYLAAEWAGLRCGLAVDRPETEYPVTYLMQVVTKLRKEKDKKQIYFVRNLKNDEVK